ncbi:MAG: hypothetical protein WCF31_01835 [Candidatus Deferrimicrobiaceae bacterium]
MKPRGNRFVFFLFACLCLSASCATTKMGDVWKDDNYRGSIRKVVVIGIFEEPDTRKIFEDEFADRLRARGVDATASHKILPGAELPDKDVAIGVIRKSGADTVLLTRVIDRKKETVDVAGQGYAMPGYYSLYGSYYRYSYRPGYTAQEGYAYTETNLYNVADEKLIWSGRAKTDFPERAKTEFSGTRYELIQAFVKIMIDGMSEARLIR